MREWVFNLNYSINSNNKLIYTVLYAWCVCELCEKNIMQVNWQWRQIFWIDVFLGNDLERNLINSLALCWKCEEIQISVNYPNVMHMIIVQTSIIVEKKPSIQYKLLEETKKKVFLKRTKDNVYFLQRFRQNNKLLVAQMLYNSFTFSSSLSIIVSVNAFCQLHPFLKSYLSKWLNFDY